MGMEAPIHIGIRAGDQALCFASASKAFIDWLRENIEDHLSVRGHVTNAKRNICYQLKYAKSDSLKILRLMYRGTPPKTYLSRKRLKIEGTLRIVGESLSPRRKKSTK